MHDISNAGRDTNILTVCVYRQFDLPERPKSTECADMLHGKRPQPTEQLLTRHLHRVLGLPQRSHDIDSVLLACELYHRRILQIVSMPKSQFANGSKPTSSLMNTLCCYKDD